MAITSARGAAMKADLPDLYLASRVVDALFQSAGAEYDAVRAALLATLNATFVAVADAWGLDLLEAEYGLPTRTAMTTADRRARLKGAMRGVGTATVAAVERAAAAYQHGAVNVEEDQANYLVTICFTDLFGVPTNLADFQMLMRAILPANLVVAYRFRYLTWAQIKAAGKTWTQLKTHPYTWAQLKTTDPATL